MEKIQIKRVGPDQVAQLQQIGRKTFSETFAPHNSEDNMARYLDEGFSFEKLTKELKNPECQFFFAVLDDNIIGYLKINTGGSQTEIKEKKALEIERIYVLQEFYGKKVGQLLYDKAMQLALEANAEYVWLGVWEQNARAIKFYEKNGFVEFDRHIFKLGEEEQVDIMMKKTLLQKKSATT